MSAGLNPELAMAKCTLEELKLKKKAREMEAEEARRDYREAAAPYVANKDLDLERIVFVSSRFVKAIADLREVESEILKLQKAYNL